MCKELSEHDYRQSGQLQYVWSPAEGKEDPLTVIALILTHYYLGTLVLADVRDELDPVPEPLKDPQLSRLFACSAIVNAISLALNRDRYCDDGGPYESILLLDPTSITMIEALWRTAKAICLLHVNEELSSSAAKMMLSVLTTALTVLSQISVTASFSLTSISQLCTKTNLTLNRDHDRRPKRLDPEQQQLLRSCDCDFIDEFMQEMRINASRDRSLLDTTIARYEQTPCISGTRNETYPAEPFLGFD